jgi:hypothetical protein
MKEKLLTIVTVLLIGVLLVLLQSCKEDDAAGETDILINQLSQTWNLHRATVDNIEVTGSFKNMTITFRADHSYSVDNAVPPIWPSAGSFDFIHNSTGQSQLKRNDGAAITITSLNDSNVILELLYTSGAGRASEVTGRFRFEMTR